MPADLDSLEARLVHQREEAGAGQAVIALDMAGPVRLTSQGAHQLTRLLRCLGREVLRRVAMTLHRARHRIASGPHDDGTHELSGMRFSVPALLVQLTGVEVDRALSWAIQDVAHARHAM